MDEQTLGWLAARLGLSPNATENEVDAFISKAKANQGRRGRNPYASSTAGRNTRLGYGAPERNPAFGGEVTPSIAARDDAGRRVEYHPRGGFFHRVFAGRATAEGADEGLPSDWFGPDGHARVRAG